MKLRSLDGGGDYVIQTVNIENEVDFMFKESALICVHYIKPEGKMRFSSLQSHGTLQGLFKIQSDILLIKTKSSDDVQLKALLDS